MPADDVARVLSYHACTKHSLQRYAAGPEALDWDAQPQAFRNWANTTRQPLPHDIAVADIRWDELPAARPPLPFNAANIGSLLRLCVGLTAWKEYAGSRWSLRAHPSSGNLHPTETWLITQGLADLPDGLHHYHNLHHALELRATSAAPSAQGVWLGFTSIHWREAWKYGERAFRYCQLDLGHVLAAVTYAAALHGWRVRLLPLSTAQVAQTLGCNRTEDFAKVEHEEAECILALEHDHAPPADWQHWHGTPSLLDPHPLYQWPVIEEVAEATRGTPPHSETRPLSHTPKHIDPASLRAAQVILKRRSAQNFDDLSIMPQAVFQRLLQAMMQDSPVWQRWPHTPRVHPLLFVHRVEGLAPGLYALPRNADAEPALRAALRDSFTWQRSDATLPLYQLLAVRTGNAARTLSCQQPIASRCALTFVMLAEFSAPIAANPAAYRHLHWEAGMLGHIATLEAEAAGWRGTGIGCFFDDGVHEVLGLQDTTYQVLYHYAIGIALDDPRISTLPAYPDTGATP